MALDCTYPRPQLPGRIAARPWPGSSRSYAGDVRTHYSSSKPYRGILRWQEAVTAMTCIWSSLSPRQRARLTDCCVPETKRLGQSPYSPDTINARAASRPSRRATQQDLPGPLYEPLQEHGWNSACFGDRRQGSDVGNSVALYCCCSDPFSRSSLAQPKRRCSIMNRECLGAIVSLD